MDAQLHDFVRMPNWKAAGDILSRYKKELPPLVYNMATKHKNSLALDMLLKECKKIAASQPAPPPVKPKSKDGKVKNEQFRVVYSLPIDEILPEDLKALKQQVIVWLATQRDIRGHLRKMAYSQHSKKQLYKTAESIIEIEALLQDAYLRLDYYTRYRRYLPGTEPVSKTDRLIYLIRAEKRNRDYIRRYENSDNERQQREIVRRKKELEELKHLIDEKENK